MRVKKEQLSNIHTEALNRHGYVQPANTSWPITRQYQTIFIVTDFPPQHDLVLNLKYSQQESENN